MSTASLPSKNIEPLWYMQRAELFQSLDAAEMKALAEKGRLLGVDRGGQVYSEGDPGKSVYLVKEGGVKIVTSNAEGKEIALAYLKELDLFGETALFDRAPREQRAIATVDSCLLVFDVATIEELMARKPEFGISITKLVGLRLKRIQTRVQSMMFRSPLQRVAALLLELAGDFGVADAATGDTELKIRITHSEIASLIGVTRESVTYAMGQLELDELIRTVRRRIFLVDKEGLAQLKA